MKAYYIPGFLLIGFLFGGLRDLPEMEAFIKDDIPFLTAFYKERHQSPEISLKEEKTAGILADQLRAAGFEVTENFGGYGIVGILKNGKGPTILYRTDMDALPMVEKTGLPYASQQTTQYEGKEVGAMHSCGHDMHMTTWLGTARVMAKMKNRWKGTLMLIGQPAEEIGAGAKMMLEAGLYDKFGPPDYGIGLHCSPTIPSGKVGFGKGFTMANTESIDIKVFGQGAHGATPHMAIDPVVIASMMVMELQTIVSRSLNPTDAAVVTVGAINGGTRHNVIPSEVTLKLTVRTYTDEVQATVHKRIEEIAKGVAMAAGLPEDKLPEVIFPKDFTPANYNHPHLVDRLVKSATSVIGKDNVVEAAPMMVGEDFSRYGKTKHQVPTVLYWLGTVPQERIQSGNLPGLHSPYYFPEVANTIKTGVKVTSQSLIDLFNQKM
ncbi:amidohydrolase [Fulvivirgaceae bacterium BMA12]|uniref:Amidohydrolase n=1 Tax=Agaribacillus aureus TaxID=3051825 RepID=A0ABT8L7X4_9BACT|nr:amidohydrolase [Fulvivirgaceae bacterium BMA12]